MKKEENSVLTFIDPQRVQSCGDGDGGHGVRHRLGGAGRRHGGVHVHVVLRVVALPAWPRPGVRGGVAALAGPGAAVAFGVLAQHPVQGPLNFYLIQINNKIHKHLSLIQSPG